MFSLGSSLPCKLLRDWNSGLTSGIEIPPILPRSAFQLGQPCFRRFYLWLLETSFEERVLGSKTSLRILSASVHCTTSHHSLPRSCSPTRPVGVGSIKATSDHYSPCQILHLTLPPGACLGPPPSLPCRVPFLLVSQALWWRKGKGH